MIKHIQPAVTGQGRSRLFHWKLTSASGNDTYLLDDAPLYGAVTYVSWERESGTGTMTLYRADETGLAWTLVSTNLASGEACYDQARRFLSPAGVLKIVLPSSTTYNVDVVVVEGHLRAGA